MDKVDPVEDTRFPPFVAKSNAQSSRTEKVEARFFEIWMPRHVFPKIFHLGNDRTIVFRQPGDEFRKVAIDASRPLILKRAAVVENSHSGIQFLPDGIQIG